MSRVAARSERSKAAVDSKPPGGRGVIRRPGPRVSADQAELLAVRYAASELAGVPERVGLLFELVHARLQGRLDELLNINEQCDNDRVIAAPADALEALARLADADEQLGAALVALHVRRPAAGEGGAA